MFRLMFSLLFSVHSALTETTLHPLLISFLHSFSNGHWRVASAWFLHGLLEKTLKGKNRSPTLCCTDLTTTAMAHLILPPPLSSLTDIKQKNAGLNSTHHSSSYSVRLAINSDI
ncbi:uncharacterized protein BO66DRAFT_39745 [Aspergillus aculeatinus CBS 121060]|uniref:Uncharacterized protein n=1 Tax=Aspergillus aculeatinus CBS 121060 TaxID=1448322 RepID=A0ACD1HFM4_9EURO|nr:hypothetical protein BO66DRAFT_39745 [Aspergillus aculeatinus CBS 121060]RAH72203.1 hypothetical protein BO66DRAFT_39745 [Aspergillus aculeatinus CBS 121060]